jgi:SAM-dependent methyltransferase
VTAEPQRGSHAEPAGSTGWTPAVWREWVENAEPARAHVIELCTRRALDALDVRPGERVLNAGCGFGREAALLLAREPSIRLTAVDGSPDMVEAAGRTLGGAASAEVRLARLEALPFPDATFDRVLCLGVLMHVAGDEAAVPELCRVLRPGGTLVVSFNSALHPAAPLVAARNRVVKRWSVGYVQKFRTPGFILRRLRAAGVEPRLLPGSLALGRGSFGMAAVRWLDAHVAPLVPGLTFEPIVVARKPASGPGAGRAKA